MKHDAPKTGAGKKRTRSPAYPTTNLEDALEKAKIVWDADQRSEVSLSSLAQHWGYNAKSSSTAQLAAALHKFGLFEGVGKAGAMKLSDLAIRILTNEDASSGTRMVLVKQAALSPKIYAQLWAECKGVVPSDVTLKHRLVADLHFNKDSVDKLIRDFRQTITFAKLTADDKSEAGGEAKTLLGSVKAEPQLMKNIDQILKGDPTTKEMRFELDSGPVTVRYPMSREDFELLIQSLNLWKKKLIKGDQDSKATV